MASDEHVHEIGSAYRNVTELRADLRVARKAHLLSIFHGDDLLHLDLEGRLHRAWLDGVSYQRGLDGRVRRVRIDRPRPEDRWLEIEVLARGDGDRMLERVHALARETLAAGRTSGLAGGDLVDPLEQASTWNPDRYAAEAARFDQIYDPIPILPPDQNRALVLQATAGCSWNRCSFCHLYHDTRFRAHPIEEFRSHVRGVLDLVGRALPLRRGVFVGQANALCIEQHRLRDAIAAVREELDRHGTDPARWPLGSFIDSFTRRRNLDELHELRALGLESVALGLESGSAGVLEHLGKPAEVPAAVELVHELGEAGITRAVIVLVGAGGRRLGTEHVDETVEAVTAMQLRRRDRVYLSPLHVIPESEYARRCGEAGLGILTREELVTQAEDLRARMRAAGVASAIALYDIRRFIY